MGEFVPSISSAYEAASASGDSSTLSFGRREMMSDAVGAEVVFGELVRDAAAER